MLIKQEATKISSIRKMLRTYFLQNDVLRISYIELFVQKETIQSALKLRYIKPEYHGNDAFYRITTRGKTYRDTKCE